MRGYRLIGREEIHRDPGASNAEAAKPSNTGPESRHARSGLDAPH
jgi:hypothetical protein